MGIVKDGWAYYANGHFYGPDGAHVLMVSEGKEGGVFCWGDTESCYYTWRRKGEMDWDYTRRCETLAQAQAQAES